jgi:hypothetical protein
LVEKVAIYVDAVGLREVSGDYLADGLKIDLLLAAIILHVSKVLTLIATHPARLSGRKRKTCSRSLSGHAAGHAMLQ